MKDNKAGQGSKGLGQGKRLWGRVMWTGLEEVSWPSRCLGEAPLDRGKKKLKSPGRETSPRHRKPSGADEAKENE